MLYSGNFASVYKITTHSGDVAVRCFTREVRDQRERYGHLSDYLRGVRPEVFVGFQYVEQGIRVRGQWYPIVKMEWAQGDRLTSSLRTILMRRKSPGSGRQVEGRKRHAAGLADSPQ